MIGVKDRIGSLREGLFAKYVLALVGLVLFVLTINGATEAWISYRATRTTITDAMSEKAQATARRIEQAVGDLERQMSWVTRAGAVDHRSDYAQLLNQLPSVSQLTLLDGNGGEQLRASRTAILAGSKADFSGDPVYRDRRPRCQLRSGLFPGRAALDVDRNVAHRVECRRHHSRDRPRLPRRFFRGL